MKIEDVKKILGEGIDSRDEGLTYIGNEYIAWTPGDTKACLDGHFTADELIAMGTYMKTKGTLIEQGEQ